MFSFVLPSPSRGTSSRGLQPALCKRRSQRFVRMAQEPCEDCDSGSESPPPRSGKVRVEYCTGCRWLLRAGWTAQELLTTFEKQLEEVTLAPAIDTGVFDVYVDGKLVFSRKEVGRFPEMKELKQLVRNEIAPALNLGHSDSKVKSA